jgi:hypothetical protein
MFDLPRGLIQDFSFQLLANGRVMAEWWLLDDLWAYTAASTLNGSLETGLNPVVSFETRPGWVYGAHWKFSAIVRELCQFPWAKNTVRPSREAARFAIHGTGSSSSWSTGVSRRVRKL